MLQELRDQLTEAERELPRADPARRPRIEQDIQDLRRRIADQQRLVADPEAPPGGPRSGSPPAGAGAASRAAAGAPTRAKFVNTPPVVAPGYFQDRHVESELIGDFLRADDERLMTVVGRGGVGKTAMVCPAAQGARGRAPPR